MEVDGRSRRTIDLGVNFVRLEGRGFKDEDLGGRGKEGGVFSAEEYITLDDVEGVELMGTEEALEERETLD